MKLFANAKINLTLDITGKREDGYHLIDSVMQSVSLCDIVTVEKAEKISVLCDNSTINQESNIAYSAAKAFFSFTEITGGAKIEIEKRIPLASGMGGGSADAAAVLIALDRIYKTNLTSEKLREIALTLGADVPFCISGGTARAQGIGEKLVPLPGMPDCAILLIKQGNKLSTKDMYKKIDSMQQAKPYTQKAVEALQKGNLERLLPNISNAFCAVCDINSVLSKVNKTENLLAVSLSGSGPTVFAIYPDETAAEKAQKILLAQGLNPIITLPAKCGVTFE